MKSHNCFLINSKYLSTRYLWIKNVSNKNWNIRYKFNFRNNFTPLQNCSIEVEMKRQDKTLRWHSIYTSKESSKNAEICNNLHIIKCKRNKIFCSVWFKTLNYYCLPHKGNIKNHKQLRSKLLRYCNHHPTEKKMSKWSYQCLSFKSCECQNSYMKLLNFEVKIQRI